MKEAGALGISSARERCRGKWPGRPKWSGLRWTLRAVRTDVRRRGKDVSPIRCICLPGAQLGDCASVLLFPLPVGVSSTTSFSHAVALSPFACCHMRGMFDAGCAGFAALPCVHFVCDCLGNRFLRSHAPSFLGSSSAILSKVECAANPKIGREPHLAVEERMRAGPNRDRALDRRRLSACFFRGNGPAARSLPAPLQRPTIRSRKQTPGRRLGSSAGDGIVRSGVRLRDCLLLARSCREFPGGLPDPRAGGDLPDRE